MARRKLLTIIVVGFVLRIGYAVAIYEPSLLPYHGGDIELYLIGAEDILSGDLPFTGDWYLWRPPLFPLLMATMNLDSFAILAANILLGTFVIPLTYLLARQLKLPLYMALLSALILALDPTSIRHSGVLQAEPLANILLAAAFVSLTMVKSVRTRPATLTWGLLAGACIVLSALARPSAYLLWIPMAIWAALAQPRWRILAAGSLIVVGYSVTGLWIQHNAVTLGHNTFSTVGNFNMLYYRATSVLHQATGQEIDEVYAELTRRVEARLGNETEDITAAKRHQHYVGSPQLQAAMTEVAIGVFREHPLHYVLAIPVGLYRTLLHVSGPLLWPGIVWNVALLLSAVYGLRQLMREKHWAMVMLLLLPTA